METASNSERLVKAIDTVSYRDIHYEEGYETEAINFIIEQAKKAQELERELKECYKQNSSFSNEHWSLQEEVKRYREALKFYADKGNYKLSAEAEKADLTDFINALDADEGHIARKALEEFKNENS